MPELIDERSAGKTPWRHKWHHRHIQCHSGVVQTQGLNFLHWDFWACWSPVEIAVIKKEPFPRYFDNCAAHPRSKFLENHSWKCTKRKDTGNMWCKSNEQINSLFFNKELLKWRQSFSQELLEHQESTPSVLLMGLFAYWSRFLSPTDTSPTLAELPAHSSSWQQSGTSESSTGDVQVWVRQEHSAEPLSSSPRFPVNLNRRNLLRLPLQELGLRNSFPCLQIKYLFWGAALPQCPLGQGQASQDTTVIRGLRKKFHLPVSLSFEMAVQELQPKYLGNAVPKGRGNPVTPHTAGCFPVFKWATPS